MAAWRYRRLMDCRINKFMVGRFCVSKELSIFDLPWGLAPTA